MPWDAHSFQKHNGSLHGAKAGHAADIANAVLRRSGDEGMAIATANKWAGRHAAGGGIVPRYDAGGATDPGSGIGGIAPSASNQSPLIQGQIQQYASLPTEKLQELAARMGGSPQGMMIQQLIQQRHITPQQPTSTSQSPVAPMRRGGTLKRDAGGMMSQGSPWWTRQEARGEDSGFLMGTTPGRADAVKTTAPGGSYVIPAEVIAGLGEGNSLAGARIMDSILRSGPRGTPLPRAGGGSRAARPPAPYREDQQPFADGGEVLKIFPEARKSGGVADGQRVDLSHGEYVISPEQCATIGGGDKKRGHAILDKWVMGQHRKHIEKLKKYKGPVKT